MPVGIDDHVGKSRGMQRFQSNSILSEWKSDFKEIDLLSTIQFTENRTEESLFTTLHPRQHRGIGCIIKITRRQDARDKTRIEPKGMKKGDLPSLLETNLREAIHTLVSILTAQADGKQSGQATMASSHTNKIRQSQKGFLKPTANSWARKFEEALPKYNYEASEAEHNEFHVETRRYRQGAGQRDGQPQGVAPEDSDLHAV